MVTFTDSVKHALYWGCYAFNGKTAPVGLENWTLLVDGVIGNVCLELSVRTT